MLISLKVGFYCKLKAGYALLLFENNRMKDKEVIVFYKITYRVVFF